MDFANWIQILMLNDPETVEDYLGRFDKCQEKFLFSSGQRGMIQIIVDACLKLLNDYTKYDGACEMWREPTNFITCSPSISKNEDISSAEQTNNEAFTINVHNQVEDEDENVETIFNSLFQHMRAMSEFAEIQYEKLDFRVLQRYNHGGVYIYNVKCPIINCSFKTKIAPAKTSRRKSMQWNLKGFKSHFTKTHRIKQSNQNE
ncbi:hypothetical protein Bhyg_04582 [Pseudolycoriella hygida]|uniref:Uncharacterized protein n=1 Tax=Pseudolycoriella hygida TaxID=35572 RepID=A0A9Q0NFX0_9DIPT|nr:hypothetical protein Bhyg_04582 [Pseudolycoriella hygida]